MRGKFITLEGIDGAGKSTFIPWIEQRLRSAGHGVIVTREPGGTSTGEKLRGILLHGDVSAESEVLLMFAARREHIVSVITPALEQGQWVLCDRFTDATFAYQGAGRGVAEHHIAALESWIQEGLRPDLTLLFDVSVDVARMRAGASRSPDRFESETHAFFTRVRECYLRRAANEPARFRVIDANGSIDVVEQQLARLELFC
jgi:dTMP kinase